MAAPFLGRRRMAAPAAADRATEAASREEGWRQQGRKEIDRGADAQGIGSAAPAVGEGGGGSARAEVAAAGMFSAFEG